jgi:type VI secretion system protein ImpD
VNAINPVFYKEKYIRTVIATPNTGGVASHLLISRLIAMIDNCCSQLLNQILHDECFKQLEASWRSLKNLIDLAGPIKNVKVKLLDISWKVLKRDLMQTVDITQCELFNKIYNQEFGMPGGEPFGVILGDYQMHLSDDFNDIESLETIIQVGAAAFSPFVMGVHVDSFKISNLKEFNRIKDLSNIFNSHEYLRWQSLRKMDEARFLGLVFPKSLMRSSYSSKELSDIGFSFQEDSYDYSHYLWANPAYDFVNTIVLKFSESNWFVNLHGFSAGRGDGLVNYLPKQNFEEANSELGSKNTVEVYITDRQERILSELGFITLCQINKSQLAAFHSGFSIQEAMHYDEENARANAKVSTELQYVFCACRFAHYIKIIGRNKVGSFSSPEDCESYLNRWIINYVAGNEVVSLQQKLAYPLREAKIVVRQNPGKPGHYFCVVHLQPRVQLEQVKSTIILVTELATNMKRIYE